METEVVTIYVVCDEVLKAIGFEDDHQVTMTTAEVIAFAIIGGKFCGGNHQLTRHISRLGGYFPRILSHSRINRRLHRISWWVWMAIFRLLAMVYREGNTSTEFAVDSFPVACCEKSRIDRRKLLTGKQFIGYAPSKKRHFCGVKVHMIVTIEGKPVELVIAPASLNDLGILWGMELQLPEGSRLYADGAYNSYDLEDLLSQDNGIQLLARRRLNSRRSRPAEQERGISSRRQIVETAFSCITRLLPRSIRARTSRGFVIRVMSAILAYSIGFLT